MTLEQASEATKSLIKEHIKEACEIRVLSIRFDGGYIFVMCKDYNGKTYIFRIYMGQVENVEDLTPIVELINGPDDQTSKKTASRLTEWVDSAIYHSPDNEALRVQ